MQREPPLCKANQGGKAARDKMRIFPNSWKGILGSVSVNLLSSEVTGELPFEQGASPEYP